MGLKGFFVGLSAGAVALGALALPAHASGFVNGIDKGTKEVGSGFASCYASTLGMTRDAQSQIYTPIPGKGSVMTLWFWGTNKSLAMGKEIANGATASQALQTYKDNQAIKDPTKNPWYDTDGPRRMYLVSTVDGDSAQYIGPQVYSGGGGPAGAVAVNGSRYAGLVGGDVDAGAVDEHGIPQTVHNSDADYEAGDLHTELSNAIDKVNRLQSVNKQTNLQPIVLSSDELNVINHDDLAERQMIALIDAINPDGTLDARCKPAHVSTNMSWLRVDEPDGSVPTNLMFRSNVGNEDAILNLAHMFVNCRLGTASCVQDVDHEPATGVKNARISLSSRSLEFSSSDSAWSSSPLRYIHDGDLNVLGAPDVTVDVVAHQNNGSTLDLETTSFSYASWSVASDNVHWTARTTSNTNIRPQAQIAIATGSRHPSGTYVFQGDLHSVMTAGIKRVDFIVQSGDRKVCASMTTAVHNTTTKKVFTSNVVPTATQCPSLDWESQWVEPIHIF